MSLVSISDTLEANKLAHVPAKVSERACDNILRLIVEGGLRTSDQVSLRIYRKLQGEMRSEDYQSLKMAILICSHINLHENSHMGDSPS